MGVNVQCVSVQRLTSVNGLSADRGNRRVRGVDAKSVASSWVNQLETQLDNRWVSVHFLVKVINSTNRWLCPELFGCVGASAENCAAPQPGYQLVFVWFETEPTFHQSSCAQRSFWLCQFEKIKASPPDGCIFQFHCSHTNRNTKCAAVIVWLACGSLPRKHGAWTFKNHLAVCFFEV